MIYRRQNLESSDPSSMGLLVVRVTLTSAAAVFVLCAATLATGTPGAPNLRVELNSAGEVALEAHEAPIGEALQAIADQVGFDVVIADGIARPPVNMSLASAPVDRLLHEVLRGRNYALVYDGDDGALRRVILLPPPSPKTNYGNRYPLRARGNWSAAGSR